MTNDEITREAYWLTAAREAAKHDSPVNIVFLRAALDEIDALRAALDAKDAQFREFTERGGRLLIEVEARRDEARALYMEAEEKFSNEVSRADAAEQKLRDVTRTLDEACADADAAEALADRYRGELKVTADWLAVQDSMAAADVAQRIRTALKGTA